MIQWAFFPKSDSAPTIALSVVEVFETASDDIDSGSHTLESNEVLAKITRDLISKGFRVETGKKKVDKIHVPVLYGLNGKLEKSFEADALHEEEKFVLEVEAGRGVTNYQFLKDLFQACMMHEVSYLGIAVRNKYRSSADFDKVVKFFDTMYASNRLQLPLKGILIIGY